MPTRSWTSVALAVAASAALCATQAAPALAAPTPPSPRITSEGGTNVVPTPSGLGLGFTSSDEVLVPQCKTGDGCAAREWEVDVADQNRRRMISNVAHVSSSRLAHRFLLGRANTYRTLTAFSGTVDVTKTKKMEITKISGLYFNTPFERVLARSGNRLVLIEIQILDSGDPMPADVTTAKLAKKAKDAFAKSWHKVPTSALPGGYVQ